MHQPTKLREVHNITRIIENSKDNNSYANKLTHVYGVLSNPVRTLATIIDGGNPFYFNMKDFNKLPISLSLSLPSVISFKHGLWKETVTSFPQNLKILKYRGGKPHDSATLPSTLISLELSNIFTDIIDSIPSSLTYFDSGTHCVSPDIIFPPSLTTLKIVEGEFSELPPSITNLTLPYSYSSGEIPLPPHLSSLSCGPTILNNHMDIIPTSLTRLDLLRLNDDQGYEFFTLPSLSHFTCLKELDLHYSFNQSVENMLPPSLTSLQFSDEFSRPLPSLPISLTKLTTGYEFNHPINFPPNLKILAVREKFDNQLHALPEGLTELHIGYKGRGFLGKFNHPLTSLPNSLTVLKIYGNFNQSINGVLPPCLRHLHLGGGFKQEINYSSLPSSLICLSLLGDFNQNIDGVLPENLQHLSLGECFTQIIKQFPPNLKHFKLLGTYPHVLPSFPQSLKYLKLGDNSLDEYKFVGPIPEYLPEGIYYYYYYFYLLCYYFNFIFFITT